MKSPPTSTLRSAFGCALVVSATLFATAAPGAETVVFRLEPPVAEAGPKSGFDLRAAVRVEPADRKGFRLDLRDLPAHKFLKVEADIEIGHSAGFELGLMMMGDGRKLDPAKMPRHRLQITVDHGKPVIDSSFGGPMGIGGSFPDFEGHFLHLPGTGSAHGPIKFKPDDPAAVMGWMGGGDFGKAKLMAVHRVTFVVPHSAPDAAIEFAWKMPPAIVEGVVDAFVIGGSTVAPFAITGLTATVLDAPVALDEAGVASRYQKLCGGDPMKAVTALNEFVAAGHGILPSLRAQIEKKADPDLEKKFAEAVAAMDDPSFQKRAAAAKALQELGGDVIPLLRRALAENGAELSVETKSALNNLADRLEKGSVAVADDVRTNRLHRLLDTLGGEEAAALKSTLPEPEIVVSPEIAKLKDTLLRAMGGVDFGIPAGDPFGGIVDPFAAPPGPVTPDADDDGPLPEGGAEADPFGPVPAAPEERRDPSAP